MPKVNNQYVTVATKISLRAFKQLEQVCIKRGIKRYDLLKMAIDCLLRYMSGEEEPSEELSRVIQMFEHTRNWESSMSLTDDMEGAEIEYALYLLRQKGKKSMRGVMVKREYFNLVESDWNVMRITDKVLGSLLPDRYARLMKARKELGVNSAIEAIDALIERYTKDEEGEELRRMFADNDRVYSNSISQQTYKTKRSRKVDYYMTKPLFDDVEPSANDESGTDKQNE